MTFPDTSSDVKRILIARFSTQGGAEAAVAHLKSAGASLGNVAQIVKNDEGEVSFSESQDWGLGKSAAVGAVAALILPGIGLVLGAAAGALAAYFIDAGFPDALLKQTGSGLLSPNQSALIALVQGSSMSTAENAIEQAGGTVLGSGLEADLARALADVRTTGDTMDTGDVGLGSPGGLYSTGGTGTADSGMSYTGGTGSTAGMGASGGMGSTGGMGSSGGMGSTGGTGTSGGMGSTGGMGSSGGMGSTGGTGSSGNMDSSDDLNSTGNLGSTGSTGSSGTTGSTGGMGSSGTGAGSAGSGGTGPAGLP